MLFAFGRGQTFFLDEWQIVLERDDWSLDSLLRPQNEHLFLVPVLALKLPLELVGFTPHWPFQIGVVTAHLLVAILVFVLVSRRLGRWLGLGAAVIVLFLGSAWEDLLLPIQVSFVGSMAAGLGMLVVFDRPPSARKDVLCSVLLLLSIACSGVGLSFAAVALVHVLAPPTRWRRLWIVAAPLLAFALWYGAYGQRELERGGSITTNLPWVPSYVADEIAAAFGALTGLGLEWGRVLAVVGVVVIVWRLLDDGPVSVRLLALLAGGSAFWITTALARAHLREPAATRYLYVGAVYVLLIAVEAWRPPRLDPRRAALLAAGILLVVVANLNELRAGRDTLRSFSDDVSARLAALELAGSDSVPPDFAPAAESTPAIVASRYFAAIAKHGSPAPLESLASMPESSRGAADDVLIDALVRIRRAVTSIEPSGRLDIDRVEGGSVVSVGPCVRLRSLTAEAALDVAVRSGALRVRPVGDDPARVALRRYGDEFSKRVIGFAPATAGLVVLPRRGSNVPWRARIVTEGRVEACSATVRG